ncbi:hypothetical protein [Porphyromonas endodontalis]
MGIDFRLKRNEYRAALLEKAEERKFSLRHSTYSPWRIANHQEERKGDGRGALSTAPRLVSEREKEPRGRVTRSLCRRAIKNINYGEKNLLARAREGGHIYQDVRLIYLPDTNKSF